MATAFRLGKLVAVERLYCTTQPRDSVMLGANEGGVNLGAVIWVVHAEVKMYKSGCFRL